MDRRWPSDAEAAAGRPSPRAATLGHAAVRAQECSASTILGTLTRAREARGADSNRGFIFWFQRRDAGAAAVGGAGRRLAGRSSIAAELGGGCRTPPAPPRRRRVSASTIFGTLTRAREARGADSRSRFHFLVSAARRRRCRGWRRWPPTGRRSSIAAELGGGCRTPPAPPRRRRGLRVNHFRHPHARARGARRRFQIAVSFFGFSGATPARRGWRRWPPTVPSSIAAELGGGCRTPPAPPRRRRGLRVNDSRHPHARARGARRRFQIAVSFFGFSGATPALPRLGRWPPPAELNRGRARRWLPNAARASAPP